MLQSDQPEPEKESDATALVMMITATRVDQPPPTEFPAPAAVQVEEDMANVGQDSAEGPRVAKLGPEIPSGEPILRPPPASTTLHVVRLIMVGEVAGILQQ